MIRFQRVRHQNIAFRPHRHAERNATRRAVMMIRNHGTNHGSQISQTLIQVPEIDLESYELCQLERSCNSLLHDGQDITRVDDEVVFAVELEFGAAPLGEDDAVADGDIEGDAGA